MALVRRNGADVGRRRCVFRDGATTVLCSRSSHDHRHQEGNSRQYPSRKPHEIVREIKGGSSTEGIIFFGQEEKNVAANKRGRNVVHWQHELDTIRDYKPQEIFSAWPSFTNELSACSAAFQSAKLFQENKSATWVANLCQLIHASIRSSESLSCYL